MARSKRAPGHLEKRGDAFRVTLCVGGKYHRFTVRTTVRHDAEDFAKAKYEELEREFERSRAGLPVAGHYSELATSYCEVELPALAPGCQRAYKDSFKPVDHYFIEILGNPRITTIGKAHIKGYLHWRAVHRWAEKPVVSPVAPRTVNKDRRLLHRLFSFAQEMELTEANPVSLTRAIKVDDYRPELLTPEQYGTLIGACEDPMLRMFVIFLGETGARCESEALWTKWEDVDLKGGFVAIVSGREGHRTKSGKTRLVPMTAKLRAALKDHFAAFRFKREEPSEWLFHHLTTRCHFQAGQRIGSLRHAFRAAAKRAKLPARLRQHDLRHNRVTWWLAQGHSAALVQEAMGHSSMAVTEKYKHLVPEHLKALVAEAPALARAQA